jgi:serine/threonine protein kinase
VVHRDLKPSNVFLRGGDGEPELRLLDFGIARLAEASETLTESHAVLGSPGYLAPEQAMGDSRNIAPAADIFALGAIAYRLLTGEDPFPSRNPAKAIYAAINVQPAAPSSHCAELGEDVDRLFALALAKDPKKRPASAGELAALLRSAIAGELPGELRARADQLRSIPGPLDDTLSMTARQ